MILFGQNKKRLIDIIKETFENNDIEVIIDGVNTLQLNKKHIEEQLGHNNLPEITNKYDKIYKNTDLNQQMNQ